MMIYRITVYRIAAYKIISHGVNAYGDPISKSVVPNGCELGSVLARRRASSLVPLESCQYGVSLIVCRHYVCKDGMLALC